MAKLTLLDPTKTGKPAQDLESKLRRFVVGQEEAIHEIDRPNQEWRTARTIAATYLRGTVDHWPPTFGTEGSCPAPNISCFGHTSTRTGPKTSYPPLVRCYSSMSVRW